MKKLLARLRIDPFTLALLCTVTLASFLPVYGTAAAIMDDVTDVAIAALFFLHGARLSREAVKAGALHWRLHLVILTCTFVLFPLLGVLSKPLAHLALTPELYVGLLFCARCHPRCNRRSPSPQWRAATCRPPSVQPRFPACWACF